MSSSCHHVVVDNASQLVSLVLVGVHDKLGTVQVDAEVDHVSLLDVASVSAGGVMEAQKKNGEHLRKAKQAHFFLAAVVVTTSCADESRQRFRCKELGEAVPQ